MAQTQRSMLDYENLEIGEPVPSYEYLLTSEMVEQYRKGVQDPDARFPTIAVKADVGAYQVMTLSVRRPSSSLTPRCAVPRTSASAPSRSSRSRRARSVGPSMSP